MFASIPTERDGVKQFVIGLISGPVDHPGHLLVGLPYRLNDGRKLVDGSWV